jgi:hypothetical protein
MHIHTSSLRSISITASPEWPLFPSGFPTKNITHTHSMKSSRAITRWQLKKKTFRRPCPSSSRCPKYLIYIPGRTWDILGSADTNSLMMRTNMAGQTWVSRGTWGGWRTVKTSPNFASSSKAIHHTYKLQTICIWYSNYGCDLPCKYTNTAPLLTKPQNTKLSVRNEAS